MAKNSRPTQQKRARERAQADRQRDKEQRRNEARERKANAPARTGDEDPDIAGIRPGPQPRLADWDDVPAREEDSENTEEES